MYCQNPLLEISTLGSAALTAGGAVAVGSSIYLFKKIKDFNALQINVVRSDSKDEIVQHINTFFNVINLEKDKINDPKEFKIWKKMLFVKPRFYEAIYANDELSEYDNLTLCKTHIVKLIESIIRFLKLKAIVAGVGGTAATIGGGVSLVNNLRKKSS